jgi:diadenosine tetraphosphate (Ap4A) HIT family hydrolase
MAPAMPTAIHRQVAACQAGDFPRLVTRMNSGWAILGDPQIVRGYCLLLPDPVVPHLNAMDAEHRQRFLADMTTLGDAVLEVTGAVRINYEMLGNLEPALHAHLFPRDDHEPEATRTAPIWLHDWDAAVSFAPKEHDALIQALRTSLATKGA